MRFDAYFPVINLIAQIMRSIFVGLVDLVHGESSNSTAAARVPVSKAEDNMVRWCDHSPLGYTQEDPLLATPLLQLVVTAISFCFIEKRN